MRHGWPIALVLTCGPALAQDLDATQRLGHRLFNQPCRVCHAKPQFNSAWYGPVLLKDSASGNVSAMREVILNGTPRMPGFRHHFKPAQVDAIVAYLKTGCPVAAPSAPAPSRSAPGAD